MEQTKPPLAALTAPAALRPLVLTGPKDRAAKAIGNGLRDDLGSADDPLGAMDFCDPLAGSDAVFLYRLADAVAGMADVPAQECGPGMMLLSRSGRRASALGIRGGRAADAPRVRRWLRDLLPRFRRAVPFAFADLRMLEPDGVTPYSVTMAPPIPAEGMALFNAGGAPLPSDTVWLEWGFDGPRWALLAWKSGSDIEAVHFFTSPTYRKEAGCEVYDVWCHDCTIRPAAAEPDKFLFRTGDPFGVVRRYENASAEDAEADNPYLPKAAVDGWSLAVPGVTLGHAVAPLWTAYLLLALRSNMKRIETVKPGAIENRKRTGKGLIPVAERRVVRMPTGWTPSEGFVFDPELWDEEPPKTR